MRYFHSKTRTDALQPCNYIKDDETHFANIQKKLNTDFLMKDVV